MRSTSKTRLLPLGLICFLVLFDGSLAQQMSCKPKQSPRLRGRSDCQFQNITAREPNRRQVSEAGFTEFWDASEGDELQCAGVEVVRHTINPKGLLLPYYPNTPELVYVVRGQGIQGTVLPGCEETFETMFTAEGGSERFTDKHQKVYPYKEGDILTLPAGVVHWTYNDGDKPLVVVALRDISNVANQLDRNFKKFFLAGNPQSQVLQGGSWGRPGQSEWSMGQPGQTKWYKGQPGSPRQPEWFKPQPRHGQPEWSMPQPGTPGWQQPQPGQTGWQQPQPGQTGWKQPQPGQTGWKQTQPGQTGWKQTQPGQTGWKQTQPGQTGWKQTQPGQTGWKQTQPGQTGWKQTQPGQTGWEQTQPGQTGWEQTQPGQTGWEQTHPGQTGWEQTQPGQTGWKQTQPGQTGWKQTQPGQTGWKQTQPGQTGWKQTQPGQPGWKQTQPGQPGWKQTQPGQPGWVESQPGQPGWMTGRPSKGYEDPCAICRQMRGGNDESCEHCNEVSAQQVGEGFNMFAGFDDEILQQIFDIENEIVTQLKGLFDDRGLIVLAENFHVLVPREQEQFSHSVDNNVEQPICTTQLSANIGKPAFADVYNPRGGRISSLNSHKLPILESFQLSAERGLLYKNAVLAPHYNLNAHSIIYITSGSSRLQIVGNDGSRVFDDVVNEGQLIVVPQNFAVIKKAGEEGCEWVAFKTNDNAITTQLAGRFSYIRSLPDEVLMNSYNISPQEAKNLKYNRKEGVVLSPRSTSPMKKAKNVVLNALFG